MLGLLMRTEGQSGFITSGGGSGNNKITVTGKRYSPAASLTLGSERPSPETIPDCRR